MLLVKKAGLKFFMGLLGNNFQIFDDEFSNLSELPSTCLGDYLKENSCLEFFLRTSIYMFLVVLVEVISIFLQHGFEVCILRLRKNAFSKNLFGEVFASIIILGTWAKTDRIFDGKTWYSRQICVLRDQTIALIMNVFFQNAQFLLIRWPKSLRRFGIFFPDCRHKLSGRVLKTEFCLSRGSVWRKCFS